MASIRDLLIRLTVDADVDRGLKKSTDAFDKAADDFENHGKKSGSRFSTGLLGSVKGLMGPLTAAFAGIGAINLFGNFIRDAAESAKIGRLTEQVIKSTGGSAKVTASQVGDLATKISNLTGVDDEAIQGGENLLLTFTNIRNETGKGNDIFNQATNAITDMSVALGQDMKSSAIQLGKALNDPIKGVTALQRVGVSFTADQKDQIKTLVESGKTLEAQKIILGELNKEFGGAAAAASSPMDKLSVIFGNLGEQIGGVFLPWIEKAAKFLGNTLIPAVSKAIDFVQNLFSGGGLSKAASSNPVIKFFMDIVQTITSVVGPVFDKIKQVVTDVFQTIMTWVNNNKSTIQEWGKTIGDIFKTVGEVLTTLFGLIKTVWDAIGDDVLNIIGAVFGTILDIIKAAFKVLKGLLDIFVGLFTGDWGKMWDGVKEVFGAVWDAILAIFKGLWSIFGGILTTAGNWIKDTWSSIWNGVTSFFKGIWEAIVSYFRDVGNRIMAQIDFLKSIPGRVGQFLSDTLGRVKAIWEVINGFIYDKVHAVIGFIGSFGQLPGKVGDWFGRVKNTIVEKFNEAVEFVKSIPGRIINALGNVGSMLWDAGRKIIQGLIDGLWSMFNNLWNTAVDILNRIRSLFPFSPAKEGPFAGHGYTTYSGKALMRDFAKGVLSQKNYVADVFAKSMTPPLVQAPGMVTPSPDGSGWSAVMGAGITAMGAGSGSITIQNMTLQFADDRDMYTKGQEFAAGLREYKSKGGVLP